MGFETFRAQSEKDHIRKIFSEVKDIKDVVQSIGDFHKRIIRQDAPLHRRDTELRQPSSSCVFHERCGRNLRRFALEVRMKAEGGPFRSTIGVPLLP